MRDGGTRAVTVRVRRLGIVQRAWYRRLGITPPGAASRAPVGDLVRLAPYRWRRFHRAFAAAARYFWLPCVLCGRPYGGHEVGGVIPDSTGGDGRGVTVCSECARRTGMGETTPLSNPAGPERPRPRWPGAAP